MNMAEFPFNYVKRALTVAMRGQFSCVLFGPSGNRHKEVIVECRRIAANANLYFNRQPCVFVRDCLCGYGGDQCVCLGKEIRKYHKKLLAEKMDIRTFDVFVDMRKIKPDRKGWRIISSEDMVAELRSIERPRTLPFDEKATEFFEGLIREMKLSQSDIHSMIKVASTIACMAKVEEVTQVHLAEARQYRFWSGLLEY